MSLEHVAWGREFFLHSGWNDVGKLEKASIIALTACGFQAPARSLNWLRSAMWRTHQIPSRMVGTFALGAFNLFPYEDLAEPLYDNFINIANEYPRARFIGVGHSLGGVALFAMLARATLNPELEKRVSKIFLLGSPIYGAGFPLHVHNASFANESQRMLEIVRKEKLVTVQATKDAVVPGNFSGIPGVASHLIDCGHVALAYHVAVPSIIASNKAPY